MYTHNIVNGERIKLTPEEIAELEYRDSVYIAPVVTELVAPTKEQLLEELTALTAKINALE